MGFQDEDPATIARYLIRFTSQGVSRQDGNRTCNSQGLNSAVGNISSDYTLHNQYCPIFNGEGYGGGVTTQNAEKCARSCR